MVPALLVLVTFLFWYQTWFGRRLTDREISQYLSDTSVPHKTQHALTQLAERMAHGDAAARQWYPQVIRLGESKQSGFRVMAAWVMGQDRKAPEFHAALLPMLADAEPMVRRNAALALVRFGDGAGRPELRAMLRPYSVVAPASGTVTFRIKEGESLRNGATLARFQPAAGESIDVISPVGGTLQCRAVPDGASVSAQGAIAVIAPGEDQVWEALCALYLVGKSDDLPDIERYASGNAKMSDRVRQQALVTARAIRERAKASP